MLEVFFLKLDELCAVAEATNPKVMCIVESWLSDEISDNELVIDNYQILQLDRNRHGGGIVMYIPQTFPQHLSSWENCTTVLDWTTYYLEVFSCRLWQGYNRLINATDWTFLDNEANIDKVWTTWENKFMTIMEECIPRATIFPRRNLPWMNRSIRAKIKKRKQSL